MGFFTKKETSDNEAEKSPVWGSQLSAALAETRKGSLGAKKRAKGESTGSGEEEARGHLSKQAEEQIKKMFDPDAWRAIVRAPFALGQAMTGRSCWELEKKQEDTLATSTSMTAEHFLQTDPKWVALTLFAFNWSVVLTEKLAMNARERAKEEALTPKPSQPHVPPTLVKP